MSDLLFSAFSTCWPLRHLTVLADWFRRCLLILLPVLLLLASSTISVQAQILDDSTRNLYGARTTRIIREDDVLRDRTEGRIIDTTLTNFPSSRNWYHDSTFYQDLGHVGTAGRPLLWRTNTQLGTRLGRNVFDRYARDPATIPYYDTKSPYTFFRFIQGSYGEQVFELSYTRSINKNASVGLAYERFAANKLYSTVSRSGLVEHTNFLLFARFQSTDERYHALFNYSNVRHRSVEQGGIQPQDAVTRPDGSIATEADSVPGDLFGYGDEVPRLFQATNTEHRDGLRFVHTYRLLGRGLTAYHIVDWRRQMNRFQDIFGSNRPSNTDDINFFPVAFLSRTATDDRAELHQVENTVGVLGRSETVTYRLYGRLRNVSLTTRRRVGEPGITVPAQVQRFNFLDDGNSFVGGTADFRYKIFAVETAGEYAFLDEYWARAVARLGPLSGELLSTSYSPTLTQQRFSGNHYRWGKDFDAGKSAYGGDLEFKHTKVNQFTARLNQTLGKHRVEGSASIINVSNLVYYDEFAEPVQLNQARQLLTASLRHRFSVGNLFFDNQVHVTRGGQADEIRIPDLITNSKVYYQGYVFKKALFGQIGAEVHYQSSWQPYDYSPSTQQFFLQNHFTAANFAVADVFVSGDIRTVAVFLKMAYINQGLLRDGYFVTPYYTSLPRRFEIGIRWQFFD